MPTAFDACFAAVIGAEGGYVNDPNDSGGETKYGVSRASYPNVDIPNLTLDGAKAIYLRDFWIKMHCDELPPPLSLLLFDSAINNGPRRAALFLQAAAGVPQDGIVGPQTIEAAKRKTLVSLLTEFQALRILYQMTSPKVTLYGLGWARRLSALSFAAIALEGQPQAPQPIVLSPDVQNAIEREITKQLQERALTDALNQRVQP